jgi:uncharacterized membrane protein YphA (DoxX/SURF4 family)
MEKFIRSFAPLFLRVALSVGYLSAVADRFGVWGPNGAKNVAWGDWAHFSAYTHQLLFFLPTGLAQVCGMVATVAELLIPVMLLIGWQVRYAALASGLLALSFALAMTVALGPKAPVDFSVWVCCAASFLLYTHRA